MEVILLSIAVVGFSFLALGVNIFFIKGKKFPETEIGKNKAMREKGLVCVKCEEGRKFRDSQRKLAAKKINPLNLSIDVLTIGDTTPSC